MGCRMGSRSQLPIPLPLPWLFTPACWLRNGSCMRLSVGTRWTLRYSLAMIATVIVLAVMVFEIGRAHV